MPVTPGPEIAKRWLFFPLLSTTNLVAPDSGFVGETRSVRSVIVTVTVAAAVRRVSPAFATPARTSPRIDTTTRACARRILLECLIVPLPPKTRPQEGTVSAPKLQAP